MNNIVHHGVSPTSVCFDYSMQSIDAMEDEKARVFHCSHKCKIEIVCMLGVKNEKSELNVTRLIVAYNVFSV